MKKSLINIVLALGCIITATSCDRGSQQTNEQSETMVSTLPLSMDIKSAERSYRITSTNPNFTCHLTIGANIQWPVAVAEYDIKPLQDTIKSLVFDTQKGNSIDGAMLDYVADVQSYSLGDSIESEATVPAEANDVYYSNIGLQLVEITNDFITFNFTSEQYMGGAHPAWGNKPFTYNFNTKSVISTDWLFEKGSVKTITPLLKEIIASQLNITQAELDESLLTDLWVSDMVYVHNGAIVFHYNPYNILPYSYGAIDAKIYPYMVSDILTPQAKELLMQ